MDGTDGVEEDRAAPPTEVPDASARLRWVLPLALVALVLAGTGHRFLNGFVYDDEHVIASGSLIHDPSRLGDAWTHHTMIASSSDPGAVQSVDTYRPVTLTLFVIDAAIWGRSPVGYHLTNLLLHIGCVLLVFVLARRWLAPEGAEAPGIPWGPFYGAAVFAVHPWAVEAHVWINGRSDPLCLLFGLLALFLLMRAEAEGGAAPRARTWGLCAAAGAAWVLGLLSKETLLLVAPAALLLPSFAGGPTSYWARLRSRAPTLVVASAIALGARVWVLGGMQTHRDAQMLGRALTQLPWLLLDACRQALVPSMPYLRSLEDEYAGVAPWQIGLGVAVVALIVGLAVRYRRVAPVSAASAAWFLSPMVPVAIVSTVLWPGFGRYLYVPLAGLAWSLAELAERLRARLGRRARARLAVPLAAHVVLLTLMTAVTTRTYRDNETLYATAIAAAPDVAMGYGWLGLARYRHERYAEAVDPLERAAELDPETHRYLIKAGRAALLSGDRARARRLAGVGVRRFSDRPERAEYHLLALNAMDQRHPEMAIAHLVACLEAWPGRSDCEDALRSLVRDAPDAASNLAILRAYAERDPALGVYLP